MFYSVLLAIQRRMSEVIVEPPMIVTVFALVEGSNGREFGVDSFDSRIA